MLSSRFILLIYAHADSFRQKSPTVTAFVELAEVFAVNGRRRSSWYTWSVPGTPLTRIQPSLPAEYGDVTAIVAVHHDSLGLR